MKLKNVNMLEMHFEKAVAGLAVLVFLGSVWLFGLGGNKATIDSRAMAPGEIDKHILDQAKKLDQAIKENKVNPKIPEKLDLDQTKSFLAKTNPPVEKIGGPLEVPIGHSGKITGIPASPPSKEYFEPKFPAPTVTAAGAGLASLDGVEIEDNPELETKFTAKAKTFETPYVSILGEWDAQAVREELTQRDPGESKRTIPNRYINSKFVILDMQVQRQVPREDGSWAEPADPDFDKYIEIVGRVPVPRMYYSKTKPNEPIEYDAEKFLGPGVEERANDLLEVLLTSNNYTHVIQPVFPQTIGGEWKPPATREELQEKKQNLDLAEQTMRDAKELIKEWSGTQRQLDNMLRPKAAPRPPSTPSPSEGPLGGGGGGRRSSSKPPATTTPAAPRGPSESEIKRREALQKKLTEFNQKYQELDTQYAKLKNGEHLNLELPKAASFSNYGGIGGPGGGPEGGFGIPRTPGNFGGPSFPGGINSPFPGNPGEFNQPGAPRGRSNRFQGNPGFPGGNLGGFQPEGQFGGPQAQADGPLNSPFLTKDTLELAAHDLSVLPGKTYRYRYRLRLSNVLFGVTTLPPAQAERNKHFVVDTEWTDWTDPIEVPRLMDFFVMSANPKGSAPTAKVEVWRFVAGQWVTKEFDVKPGEPVGDAEVRLNIPVVDDKAISVDFFTGAYAMDFDEAKVPVGTKTRSVTRVLFLNGDKVDERRADTDNENPRRKQLDELRREINKAAGGRTFSSVN